MLFLNYSFIVGLYFTSECAETVCASPDPHLASRGGPSGKGKEDGRWEEGKADGLDTPDFLNVAAPQCTTGLCWIDTQHS